MFPRIVCNPLHPLRQVTKRQHSNGLKMKLVLRALLQKKKPQKIHKLAGRGQTKCALPPPYPHAIVSSQRPSLHLRPAISQKHTLKGGGGSHCLASGDVVMPCTRVPPRNQSGTGFFLQTPRSTGLKAPLGPRLKRHIKTFSKLLASLVSAFQMSPAVAGYGRCRTVTLGQAFSSAVLNT